MELTIVYIIIVLSLAFSTQNKGVNLLLVLTLYLLFAFEHSDQDYIAYVNSYESVGSGRVFELLGYEPSYFLFCTFGNRLGLSFDAARAIICVFEVLAIYSTIKVFTNKVACVIALFLIFPATADAELFRWLAGMCMVLFAFPYLIRGGSKWDYFVYSGLILLAATLHTSCLFFLLYNLLYINNKKFLSYIIFCASIIIFMTAQTGLLYKIIALFQVNENLDDKFQLTEQSNIFGMMALAIRESFILFLGYYVYFKYIGSVNNDTNHSSCFSLKRTHYSQQDMSNLLYQKLFSINLISILLIVIAVYTPQVQRLFHVLLFLNCLAAICMYRDKKTKNLIGTAALCCTLTLLFHLLNGEQNVEIFLSHFKEGFLMNLFNSI